MSNVTYKKDLHDVALAVAQGSKNYTDNSIEKLKWELGTYDLSITTDSTVAYTKTIPANAIKGRINYIGGASKVSENLKDLSYPSVSYYRNNLTSFINTSDTSTTRIRTESVAFEMVANKTYYINNIPSGITLLGVAGFSEYNGTAISNAITSSGNSFTTTRSDIIYIFFLFGGSNFDDTTKTLFNQIGIFESDIYEPYFENIRSAKTTSVVVSGTDVAPITKAIPSGIQALEGYGLGLDDTTYNYIDLINKKFIQKVGRVYLGSLNWTFAIDRFYSDDLKTLIGETYSGINYISLISNNYGVNTTGQGEDKTYFIYKGTSGSSVDKRLFVYDTTYGSDAQAFKTAMSGVYLYYELATPVETDISQYIDDDFKNIDTTNMTTATFENEFGYAVPSEIDYLIEEVKA